MRFILCLFTLCFSVSLFASDPFQNITRHQLDNGMTIILSPNQSAKNVMLKLVVDVGSKNETVENLEVSHVLEHTLFRDGDLKEGKTYLQVIKEEGGNVNAYVNDYETAYHTTIPAEKTDWLLNEFKKMLFYRDFKDSEIDLAKSSVLLEIDEPFFLNKFIGKDIFASFARNYFSSPGYWESEFGFIPHPFSKEEERISVYDLNLSKVQQHYKNYYYPSNMTVYLAGNFKTQKVLKQLTKLLGDVPSYQGKKSKKEIPSANGQDYIRIGTTVRGKTKITYGTKFHNISDSEFHTVDSYMEYLAHRLMIELRNKKGETYTAYAYSSFWKKAGYSIISFETPADKFIENRNYVRKLINDEAFKGNFSNEDVKKAIDLYLKKTFEIADVDAETAMNHALQMNERFKSYGVWKSPYKVLSEITPDDYRINLKKVFETEGMQEEYKMPPLFFNYDLVVLFFFVVFVSVLVFKKFFTPMESKQTRHWIYKVSTTPGAIYECSMAFILALITIILIEKPIYFLLESSSVYLESQFFVSYLSTAFSISGLTFLTMYNLTKIPVSIAYIENEIVIKSIILRNECFNIESVKSVELVSFKQKLFPHKFLFSKYLVPTMVFDWFFFKPSLLINMNDGSAYLLNVKNAQEVKNKIESRLTQSIDSEIEPLIA